MKIAILGAGWLATPLSEFLSKNNIENDLIRTKDLTDIQNWNSYDLFISSWPKENILAFQSIPKEKPLIAMSSTSASESIIMFEEKLKNHFSHLMILRLGGLIGYNRHPGKFLSGKIGIKGKNHYINLVHRDDIIQIIYQIIIQQKFQNSLFKVVCDNPPLKKQFYVFASNELGLKIPEFDESDESEKPYVDGSELKKLLNYEFIYSSPFDYLNALRERKNNRT